MKKLVLLFFALTFGSTAFAAPTPITGTLKTANGSRFNGKIVFFLPFAGMNDTTCTPNPCPIVPGVVTYPVANGNLPTYAALVANGDMSTKGTYYQVGLFDSYGTKAAVFNVVIPSGLGTFDIGTASQTTVTTQNLNLVNPLSSSTNNTFTGSNTFMSSTTFNGSQVFKGPISGIFHMTTTSLFTSGQNNIPAYILNQGYDPTGEIVPHFSSTFLAGQLVPAGTTTLNNMAVTSALASFCDSLNETVCNSVANYSFADARANNAAVWAGNTVASDAPGITGAHIRGGEDDVNAYGSPTLIYGRQITGLLGVPGSVIPANTIGLLINTAAVNGGQWPTAISLPDGTVSGTGLFFGAMAKSGTSIASMPIGWNFFDSSAVEHSVAQSVDAKGLMNFAQGIKVNGSAPTCGWSSGGGTAPSCTLDTGSTNQSGIIIATTGTGSPLTKGTITLTFTNFSNAFGTNKPVCIYEPSDDVGGTWADGATIHDKTPSVLSDLFTWVNGTTPVALTVSTAYRINYQCWAK